MKALQKLVGIRHAHGKISRCTNSLAAATVIVIQYDVALHFRATIFLDLRKVLRITDLKGLIEAVMTHRKRAEMNKTIKSVCQLKSDLK